MLYRIFKLTLIDASVIYQIPIEFLVHLGNPQLDLVDLVPQFVSGHYKTTSLAGQTRRPFSLNREDEGCRKKCIIFDELGTNQLIKIAHVVPKLI